MMPSVRANGNLSPTFRQRWHTSAVCSCSLHGGRLATIPRAVRRCTRHTSNTLRNALTRHVGCVPCPMNWELIKNMSLEQRVAVDKNGSAEVAQAVDREYNTFSSRRSCVCAAVFSDTSAARVQAVAADFRGSRRIEEACTARHAGTTRLRRGNAGESQAWGLFAPGKSTSAGESCRGHVLHQLPTPLATVRSSGSQLLLPCTTVARIAVRNVPISLYCKVQVYSAAPRHFSWFVSPGQPSPSYSKKQVPFPQTAFLGDGSFPESCSCLVVGPV